jgi:hypothetical protein
VAQGSARDIIGCAEENHDPEKKSAFDEAVAFLRATLAEKALPAAEVIAAAKAIGITQSTLKRAKPLAGVKTFKQGMPGGNGPWVWWLTDPTNSGNEKSRDQGIQFVGAETLDPFEPIDHKETQQSQGTQHPKLEPLDPLIPSNSRQDYESERLGSLRAGQPVLEGEL